MDHHHRYRLGDQGAAVAEIRAKLGRLGFLTVTDDPRDSADIIFDGATDQAVRQFQQQRGLTANGIVDPQTYRVLDEACWQLGDRLLSYQAGQPLVGDDISELQDRLSQLGFSVGRRDGAYGPAVEGAVREFQRSVGLPPDGACGPATFKALARSEPPASRRAVRGNYGEGMHPSGPGLPGKIVVLDPGHGGDDHGNVVNGLAEADLAFDLASRVEGRLTATGVRAFLTRGRDNGPDDAARTLLANETGADLIISLHIDAQPNPQANGVATYYYGSGSTDAPPTVGAKLAGLVQREIVARTDLLDARTHPKSWHLLRYTDMPAVQVELGYLSNPGDAARLADSGFRDAVAEAIVVAVQRVFLPPELDAPTGALTVSEIFSSPG